MMLSWWRYSRLTNGITQEADFPEDSLCVNQVLEGVSNFLDGHLAIGAAVESRADHPVGSVTDLLDVLVAIVDTEGGSSGIPLHLRLLGWFGGGFAGLGAVADIRMGLHRRPLTIFYNCIIAEVGGSEHGAQLANS